MRRPAFFALMLTLAACGQQEAKTYPPQYELNFMRACHAQRPAAPNQCPCTWERITREIPPDEFATFERLPPSEQVAHPLYTEIQRYAVECVTQTEATPEDPPPP
jgi:hypothetical protein